MTHILCNIKKVGVIFGFMAILSSCIDEIPMIDPPKPKNDNENAFIGYFVKEDGTGAGLSWDDAMSPMKFRSMFALGFRDGDEIYMAGGTYYVGEIETEFLAVSKGIIVRGGFDPASTGYNTEIAYPSKFETIISGDINKNGKADAGDCHLMEVSSQIPAVFQGITFKCGYLSTATDLERPGIFVKENGCIELSYCKITDCISAVTATNNSAGGAALALYCGQATLVKTIISDNTSENRGGAIRLMGETSRESALYLDACLLFNNKAVKMLGGAIQSGRNTELYMNNTTIVNNTTAQSGAAINSDNVLVIINSTIAHNYCTGNITHGHDIRCASAKCYIINSIVAGDKEKLGRGANVCIDGKTCIMTSSGNNTFSVVAGPGTFTQADNDLTGKYYSDVFGDNVLADNGGYSQTIALNNSQFTTVPIAAINKFMIDQKLPFDAWVDQRGAIRNTSGFLPGACELKK